MAFSGPISGLGCFLGSHLDASGLFLIVSMILHTEVFANVDFCISFFFSMLPYVKRHGRPNFPKVVSSCFRAGNWEWV